jgi:hypothetical protein
MDLIEEQIINLMKYIIRNNTIRLESTGRVSFTNNQVEVELYANRVIKNDEAILDELRIRKGNDEWPQDEFSKKIVTLSEKEIKANAIKRGEEKANIRKAQEERMIIKKKTTKEESTQKKGKSIQMMRTKIRYIKKNTKQSLI